MVKLRSITAVRLQERMDEIGVSQDQLAAAIGCTQATISRILTGASQNSRWLPKIAVNLAVNLNWLMGVTDQKIDMVDVDGEQISEDTLAAMRAGVIANRLQRPEQLGSGAGIEDKRLGFRGFPSEETFDPAAQAAELGMVAVRELNLAFGMGATFLDVPVTEQVRYFPREWLRQFTKAAPEHLAWVQGVGDSMAPTLLDSDTLLLDLSKKSLSMSDQIWALAYCGLGMVKRLRPTPDGGLRLLSDNPAVPEETSHDGEVQLIGRVVAFTRKL
ncbi:LexA family transcriptional regulator [Novosphingobium sp.]|uniref:XRE family transcriptional regulator n=1 Tax=Novosphingobium sp. TaxID=1874826 RepID=UPI001D743E6D|nr:LexA family transcriptional regulator [Novosphingobium sp.]MBX9661907.1 LexA family transcriptional regulator [Novosphingobium sp.]